MQARFQCVKDEIASKNFGVESGRCWYKHRNDMAKDFASASVSAWAASAAASASELALTSASTRGNLSSSNSQPEALRELLQRRTLVDSLTPTLLFSHAA